MARPLCAVFNSWLVARIDTRIHDSEITSRGFGQGSFKSIIETSVRDILRVQRANPILPLLYPGLRASSKFLHGLRQVIRR